MKNFRSRFNFISSLFVATVLAIAGCDDDGGSTVIVYPDLATPQVALEGASYSVEVGKEITLTARTTGGTDTSYSWVSGDSKIATVTGGKVKGVAKGETTITVMGDQTKAGAARPIVVIEPPPPPVPTVSISGDYVVLTNTTVKLTAATANGMDSGYDWTSSDAKIATVATDGTVKGVSPGKVAITATGKDSKKAATYNMVVSNDVPKLADWLGSGHADKTSVPFTNWDKNMPAEIPTSCARCHSTPGFRDYLGDDGSAVNVVDKAAAIGTVVDCKACHNQATQNLSSVTFPSGVVITDLGSEAICMTCHQGRSSTDTVNKMITDAMVPNDDTVSAKITFSNIHYYAAGATLEAGRVRGGYQYASNQYDWRFRHVPGYDACQGCHDPHSLKLKITECAKCHGGVATVDDLKKVRMIASATRDYDGDGDVIEGIYYEIAGLQAKLYDAIKAYPVANATAKICYDPNAYPYWYKDANGNGTCEMDEVNQMGRYVDWTARLARAAYNYQVSKKDPGAFAHNGKYIIQLLFDSITDINTQLQNKIDMAKAVRNDPGHFDGTAEASRDWDANVDGVPSACSRCHGGSTGYRFYITYGATGKGIEQNNGLDCSTCHDAFGPQPADNKVSVIPQVTFASLVVVKPDANNKLTTTTMLCMNCHSGREAKLTVDAAIAAGKPTFRNIHYFAAGATLMGKTAAVGYEYPNKTYAGQLVHTGGVNCVACHSPKNTKHTFNVNDNLKACTDLCHMGIAKVDDIRVKLLADYDGDGKAAEPLKDELSTMREKLYAEMQAKSNNTLCYSSLSYPYWFKDANNNKVCETNETDDRAKAFAAWTPELARAAFNYQMSYKDPGAWAHNFAYIGQLLYDSIGDLNPAGTAGLTRP